VFDPRANALNLIRLLLALGVLLRHSFTMLGASSGWPPAEVLMRSVFVDAFFAISGFLILGSWISKPDVRRYARARFLRIMPGFWVCLVVTAFVLAPLHALITGYPITSRFVSDEWGYVWRNSALWIFQEGIDGTPTGASPQESGTWNGSLWTLSWEFACYVGVLVLGVTRLVSKRAVIVVLFLGSLSLLALTSTDIVPGYLPHHAARFATMFLAGAVVYTFRDRIPASRWLLLPAAAVVLLSTTLPDYRLIGALPLAYLVIVAGALIKNPALRLPTDLSYGTYIYGYPMQQMLVGVGAVSLGVLGFFAASVAVVLPMALLSWRAVERPALRLKNVELLGRFRRPTAPVPPASGPGDGG
jgi:peptidoglycan/LPS O-acetylase OafA/YrhL